MQCRAEPQVPSRGRPPLQHGLRFLWSPVPGGQTACSRYVASAGNSASSGLGWPPPLDSVGIAGGGRKRWPPKRTLSSWGAACATNNCPQDRKLAPGRDVSDEPARTGLRPAGFHRVRPHWAKLVPRPTVAGPVCASMWSALTGCGCSAQLRQLGSNLAGPTSSLPRVFFVHVQRFLSARPPACVAESNFECVCSVVKSTASTRAGHSARWPRRHARIGRLAEVNNRV